MQPIKRSTLIEEVGESLVLEGIPSHGTRRTVVEVALQEAIGVSAKGWICGAAKAVVRRGSSPPTPKLSTGKMNPQGPGWNKRLRIGASAPSLTPCPPRISAFEKAVRVFIKNPTEDEPWIII
ncbi:hypothetical protein CFC21_023170 [Triticum aestivum]|uniref:Uncharacterized protein n=2 Tax=Triticum aestivum TaxID=4565 RepID=A0A9R1EDQ1_WHEAT|nr:hypothetical protein CFC21_023169 [Triticum aestivum]KAF7008413.1 hypothetical protein CFC21_023170 [Triticum aestivum]